MPKFLIIRFSSIGDIIQCMGVLAGIRRRFPDARIDWVARKDMASVLEMNPLVDHIWAFDRKSGFKGLLRLAFRLRREKYDYIYDAHSNIRSAVLKCVLARPFGSLSRIVVRSKERFKRFLLFRLHINRFPKPFRGMESFRKPLARWGITDFPDEPVAWKFPPEYAGKFDSLFNGKTVTFLPSANWDMKRWPVGHWAALANLLKDCRILVLAGPADTFCEEIRNAALDRVTNLAGTTSLLESCYLVSRSGVVVSADTGFLHAADLLGIPAVALMGPTAFGYPTGPSVKVLECPLSCRPCTKDGSGKCSQSVYRRCMVEITPEQVAAAVRAALGTA